MHRMIICSFLLLISLLFFPSCQTKKPLTSNEGCQVEGTVKEIGLAGCRFLIELKSGERLFPAETNFPNFAYKAEQRIRFSYKEIKDAMSICMAEDKIVEITCIENIKE